MTEDITFENIDGGLTGQQQSPAGISETNNFITEHDIARYLLQYLLDCRGICHEDMLLIVLSKLQKYAENTDSQKSPVDQLMEIVKGINVKLNPIGYKISRVSHGMGKGNVSSMLRESGVARNNRFYVYINMVTSEESKLATRFSTREIEFIKWCVEKLCLAKDCELIVDSPIITEIDRIRNDISWSSCITFSVKSSEFFQYKDWSPIEIETLISKLCGLKWFTKDENGRVSMDLRGLVELEEYLASNGIPTCENCNRLMLQGVRCPECSRSWHIDCYQHYVVHVGKECPCGNSILQNGIYIV